jgi:predicted kinase
MKAIIFDVDGTMADCTHRTHLLPNWPKFFAEMGKDDPIMPIVWLADQLIKKSMDNDEEFKVIVVTARPDSYRDQTCKWLQNHLRWYAWIDKIYMRRDGDYRQDTIVKEELLLQQIINDGYQPWLVIDDRPEVVDMWRDWGITTLQCASDEIKLKHDGQHCLDIMVGPAGAGKSIYCSEVYKNIDIISTDAIRARYNWGHSPEDLAQTWRYAHALVRANTENLIPTVFDATNLHQKDRFALLRNVPKGQYVRYIVIDRRLEDKERTRGWRSEELILRHHRTMQKEIGNILSGDGLPNVVVLDRKQHK